jgi:hypothetical protein
MEPRKIVQQVRENASRYGARAALHDLEHRLVNRVAHVEVLKGMRVLLGDVPSADMFEAPGFEARFVPPSELEAAARAGTHEISFEFLERARERGDRCYGIYEGATLASYGWYAQKPTLIDEHFLLHFDPTYTYMFKGYTLPAYRGKRLHAVGMCRALRSFTEEGQKGLISFVASHNFASLRSVARMGYQIFGDLYLVRAGKHAFAFASKGCRPYGFSATVVAPGVTAPAPDAALAYQRLSWR